jgi:magnesium-transporting ATPase (P-type)
MSDNINSFGDEELNDNNHHDNLELQEQKHHHHDHHKPIVDRLVRANQDAINQNDDLKLAQYINEHGISTNTEEQFQASTSNSSTSNIDTTNESIKYNGLSSEEAARLLQQYGKNVIPNRQYESKCTIYMKQLFCYPMPIMIWIAIIILLLINNIFDAIILCIIQFVNATISYYEINKANDAMRALQSNLQPTATCKRDSSFQVIDAAVLVPNDIILLSSGCTVPADCRIIPSSSSLSSSSTYYIDVDQSSLTGESIPITFYRNDTCKMGSVVVRGEVEVSYI